MDFQYRHCFNCFRELWRCFEVPSIQSLCFIFETKKKTITECFYRKKTLKTLNTGGHCRLSQREADRSATAKKEPPRRSGATGKNLNPRKTLYKARPLIGIWASFGGQASTTGHQARSPRSINSLSLSAVLLHRAEPAHWSNDNNKVTSSRAPNDSGAARQKRQKHFSRKAKWFPRGRQ